MNSLDAGTRLLLNYSETREFLREAYKSREPLDIYDLHVKYGLSPGQISRVARELEARKIITAHEQSLLYSLTEYGRCWITKYRRQIFGEYNIWRDVPDRYANPGKKFRFGIPRDKRILTPFDIKRLAKRIP